MYKIEHNMTIMTVRFPKEAQAFELSLACIPEVIWKKVLSVFQQQQMRMRISIIAFQNLLVSFTCRLTAGNFLFY